MKLVTVIDALLPQTQCTKCGHNGCKPYAEAIAQGEIINKCPPGGNETIKELAALLDTPVIPLEAEAPSLPLVAYIREVECIGCTKCIQACPVDAIVGAAKLMHTVISNECTGCDLCVTPCPVDCIEMRPLPHDLVALTGGSAETVQQRVARKLRRDHARKRFEARNARLKQEIENRQQEREARLLANNATMVVTEQPTDPKTTEQMKAQKVVSNILTAEQKRLKIELAMAQVTLKKVEKQLQQYNTPELTQQVSLLKSKVAETQQAFEKAMEAKESE